MKTLHLWVGTALLLSACVGSGQVKTWTTTSHFNEGLFFNTNATSVPGEIRLNRFGTAPVPFINIPVGGGKLASAGWTNSPGRIVRIDTTAGRVVGEYRLSPEQLSSAPSRAVVDSLGNVWVTNRYDGFGVNAVTKVGVLVGGTRYYRPLPGVFVPHPLGEYVREPVYTTGVDRDGDGYIRTSAGPGNLLGWNATAGSDLDSSVPPAAPGIVQQADDELITVYKRLSGGGNNTRAVAVDEENNIWVGNDVSGHEVWKLDGTDGHKLLGYPIGGSYVYSMFFQGGFLWVSGVDRIRRLNVTNGSVTVVGGPNNASLATVTPLDEQRLVVVSTQDHSPAEWLIVDKASATITSRTTTPGSSDMRGVAIDQAGTIWIASRGFLSAGNFRVYRYRQDGTLISEFYTGDRPGGIGLDSNGLIWVTHLGNPNNLSNGTWATVIDPDANSGTGAIVGYVGLGTGSYNYSDGTGATTSQIARDGEWRVTLDSFRPNLKWGTIDWDASIPAQTSIEVFARAANTRLGLNSATFYEYPTSGSDPAGPVEGRYVEVRVRLARALGTPPDLTPAVRALTLKYARGTVSGTVGLSNWLKEAYPTADFILRSPGGANTPVPGIELGPFGAFAFTTPLRGSYSLLAKSSHWLQQRLTVPLNITDDGAHGNVFALLNGDIDQDNEIGVGDYALLSSAYGSIPGDPNWYADADLDGDDEVNIGDYSILSGNYGFFGDE